MYTAFFMLAYVATMVASYWLMRYDWLQKFDYYTVGDRRMFLLFSLMGPIMLVAISAMLLFGWIVKHSDSERIVGRRK